MHNAYLPPEDWSDSHFCLSQDESKHLVSSLRAEEGDELIVFDGKGRSALARIDSIEGRGKTQRVSCSVTQEIPDRAPSTKLTILQALPKGNRMDFLVEKATELGAWRILPLKTEHVEKQAGARGFDGQVKRWERVSLSAAKQCGSAWLPSIDQVSSFEDGIKAGQEADLFLVCALTEDAQPLDRCLEAFGKVAGSVAVLIGPEGDFTQGEIDAAVSAGAKPVSFGKLVLRVETAAIYAASVLKNHFQWDAWE
jgi:16S rRNA (uracil1498-N3)-methyltransferase